MAWSAWTIHVLVSASYLVLYTAFDKQTKRLSLALLVKVLTNADNKLLIEVNKLISLVGITLLCVAALLPNHLSPLAVELSWHAAILLCAHTSYSLLKYYGDKGKLPYVETMLSKVRWRALSPSAEPSVERTVALRTLSVVFGVIAQVALLAVQLVYAVAVAAPLALCAGMAHFWTMETDYKWKLDVRPWAYLPFLLFAGALLRWATGGW